MKQKALQKEIVKSYLESWRCILYSGEELVEIIDNLEKEKFTDLPKGLLKKLISDSKESEKIIGGIVSYFSLTSYDLVTKAKFRDYEKLVDRFFKAEKLVDLVIDMDDSYAGRFAQCIKTNCSHFIESETDYNMRDLFHVSDTINDYYGVKRYKDINPELASRLNFATNIVRSYYYHCLGIEEKWKEKELLKEKMRKNIDRIKKFMKGA